MKRSKYIIFSILLILLITIYILITTLVLNDKTKELDLKIVDFILEFRGDKYNFIYYFNVIITHLGYVAATIILLLLLLILTKCNLKSLFGTTGVILAVSFNELIKKLYKRERMDVSIRWDNETSYSYPSGHSNTSTILYGIIIYIILKSNLKKSLKIILISICIIIPILVYISRLILLAHYFTDVIGGITNGLFFLTLTILLIEVFENNTQFDGFRPYIESKLNKK